MAAAATTAAERIAFIAGVIGMPLLIALLTGGTPDTHVTSNAAVLVLAGLLVGIGTRVANGCTSATGSAAFPACPCADCGHCGLHAGRRPHTRGAAPDAGGDLMLRIILALLAGSLFGAGLMLSGMTDTAKVQGFLDIFGHWDPTLAFVMGGRCCRWRWHGG